MSAVSTYARRGHVASLGVAFVILGFAFLTGEACFAKAVAGAGLSDASALSSASAKTLFCNSHSTIPYYTATQQSNTLAFLEALKEALPPLTSRWQCGNFCAWDGVHCNEDGVEIVLDSSTLYGSLPQIPPNVDSDEVVLTSLELYGESQTLSGPMPWSWMVIPSLVSLKLRGVGLSGTSPSVLPYTERTAQMRPVGRALGAPTSFLSTTSKPPRSSKLVVVDLSNNNIHGPLPDLYSIVFPLAYAFYLQNNSFTGTLPLSWNKLTHLGILRLNHNFITGTIPAGWASMKNISVMDLEHNDLCGCVPQEIQALEHDTSRFKLLQLTTDTFMRTHQCNTTHACIPISSSSSSAPSSSSSSASKSKPSASSSAAHSNSTSSSSSVSSSKAASRSSSRPSPIEPSSSSENPHPVEPSSSSATSKFIHTLSAMCPNIIEFDTDTVEANKDSICCLDWKGSSYVAACGDAIGGYSNSTVTCSGSLGSRGAFSCCTNVYPDGTAQYVGLRCQNLDGNSAAAPSKLWDLSRNAGSIVVVVVTAIIVSLC
ncbi:proteophosphoglycan ppg4 [Leptomonas pyrrhocoris]|uniref:Proteophosphoglycan ppg4 n=1 Tax=Leptomonas pyrrhocoris TaxID=157538 RepID=A0A0M9GAB9_LEPPY|nr:proteophosphoglycan ppg4 [Leptomonas pyrrhocoris]XP_015664355.1 proteophosphoglycan ppg4 [Leptomonas pyrrhocoris]KPA85915.1 proteophosphoglycan ppg4 [Leptomonas pyrrhocoris]KPA85916.1 proteophosphoglycan ppg4 [Leptomonas pyrrhocoris]|eukprot:XP_015664354.1 proteophosphoglycan ppg4 [Leptomonas pyrrhocoris]